MKTPASQPPLSISDFLGAAFSSPGLAVIVCMLGAFATTLGSPGVPNALAAALFGLIFLSVIATVWGAVPSLVFGGLVLAAYTADTVASASGGPRVHDWRRGGRRSVCADRTRGRRILAECGNVLRPVGHTRHHACERVMVGFGQSASGGSRRGTDLCGVREEGLTNPSHAAIRRPTSLDRRPTAPFEAAALDGPPLFVCPRWN